MHNRKAIGTRAAILVRARVNARWPPDFAVRTFGSPMTGLPADGACGC
jgi:hypothetical protein